MSAFTAYFTLFFASLLAATILPAQSEAILVGMLLTKNYDVSMLILFASIGNILGSVVNWAIGRGVEKYKHKKWFPVSEDRLDKTSLLYKKYGRWLLLLSWVPIIGDPITVVAGVLKERFSIFILLVTIAKSGRYLLLAYMVVG